MSGYTRGVDGALTNTDQDSLAAYRAAVARRKRELGLQEQVRALEERVRALEELARGGK